MASTTRHSVKIEYISACTDLRVSMGSFQLGIFADEIDNFGMLLKMS